jgi:hypothetical protein
MKCLVTIKYCPFIFVKLFFTGILMIIFFFFFVSLIQNNPLYLVINATEKKIRFFSINCEYRIIISYFNLSLSKLYSQFVLHYTT